MNFTTEDTEVTEEYLREDHSVKMVSDQDLMRIKGIGINFNPEKQS